jgi:hypothetical protein
MGKNKPRSGGKAAPGRGGGGAEEPTQGTQRSEATEERGSALELQDREAAAAAAAAGQPPGDQGDDDVSPVGLAHSRRGGCCALHSRSAFIDLTLAHCLHNRRCRSAQQARVRRSRPAVRLPRLRRRLMMLLGRRACRRQLGGRSRRRGTGRGGSTQTPLEISMQMGRRRYPPRPVVVLLLRRRLFMLIHQHQHHQQHGQSEQRNFAGYHFHCRPSEAER